MKKRALWLCVLCPIILTLPPGPLRAYDSEWPPAPDPHYPHIPPGPGLQAGQIDIAIPEEFGRWMRHMHWVGWGTYPLTYAIGDVEGPDDGDLNIVMHMAEEFVLAGRLTINWDDDTGEFTPLWAWKTPRCPEEPDVRSGFSYDKHGEQYDSDKFGVLIWDFNADGYNEVAVVAPDPTYTPENRRRAIYLLATDPDPPAPPYESGWSVPPPLVLCTSEYQSVFPWNENTTHIGQRLGVCRVRDTPYRQNLITHSHSGGAWAIWDVLKTGETWSIAKAFHKNYDGHTCHEWNWADTDGDGYDEFIYDGILDFVDKVDGVATPTNGMTGVYRWRTGHHPYPSPYGHLDHADQMFVADFDPIHPGLEIMSIPEGLWKDSHGVERPGKTVLWDLEGNILRQADGPFTHPQTIVAGNFVPDEVTPGLVTLHTPKSYSPPTVQGEHILCGTYAEDYLLDTIAVDGAYWKTVAINGQYPTRSTGPTNHMVQIDWDGDYSSDEILDQCWNALIVWRMGKKGDWLPGPPPAGMPTQSQVALPWTETVGGSDFTLWWDFYQGYNGGKVNEWGWNHGGAGRYTHYYEKLAEAYGGGLCSVQGWDVGKDYREEVVAVVGGSPSKVMILYNPEPLADPDRYESPMKNRDYRQYRMDLTGAPFDYSVFQPYEHSAAGAWGRYE